MSRTAALPLDDDAVRESDDEFYANHPELVQADGERTPVDPNDPAQASLQDEWLDLYEANGGTVTSPTPSDTKPSDLSCPCPPKQGELIIIVLDPNGNPVPDATVSADGLKKQTDDRGYADFGLVDCKTYDISATKQDYSPWGVYANTVDVVPLQTTTAQLGLELCIAYRLTKKPLLIAQASQSLTPPLQTISIHGSAGGTLSLQFGQDTTFGAGGKPPTGVPVAYDEATLRDYMSKLVGVFADDDKDGKAQREFDAFQKKNSSILVYTDPKLDEAVQYEENFWTYPDRALNAPGAFFTPSKTRIHQALEAAGWDVNAVVPITDLGVPAFNAGSKILKTGDWGNGLAVMIDAVQYVMVYVDDYKYDECNQQYTITLIFELYDVFGLDDEDIKTYGVHEDFGTTAEFGISAWWQLQHQYSYAPLITKAVVTKTFTVSIQ